MAAFLSLVRRQMTGPASCFAPYSDRTSASAPACKRPAITGVSRRCVQGHFSAVTDLAVAPGNWSLLSAGRDSVVIMWDLRTFAKLATVPVYEVLEGAGTRCATTCCAPRAALHVLQILSGHKCDRHRASVTAYLGGCECLSGQLGAGATLCLSFEWQASNSPAGTAHGVMPQPACRCLQAW